MDSDAFSYTPPFVRNRGSTLGDDPFQEKKKGSGSGKSTPKHDSIMKEKNWRSGSSGTGASVATGSPTKAKKYRITVRTSPKGSQKSHSDSGPSTISRRPPTRDGVDYESLIRSPPSCCVFVAK